MLPSKHGENIDPQLVKVPTNQLLELEKLPKDMLIA
jgi:hypothetical protein